MATVTYFLPNTDSQVRLTLTDLDGVAITGGSGTATIYSPSGAQVATGVALSHISGGVWKFDVAAAWSYSGGVYIVGEFVAVITHTYSGKTLTTRIRYPVMFDDNT